ncbi:MAG: hypothetical protein DME15_16540 [Candidatus Rokuibacteriota bacterium]|nr:MAG: hypothetical protein DME15_16540 [Candidatus Rokubacteria bacterium]PYN59295.1 MAG: hypothetical protein DMD92_09510 [Candidatus Rokubacteria bacterium]
MIRGMTEGRPAGFWLRALALAVDFAIFLIVRTSYRALARAVPGASDNDWTHGPLLSLFTLLFAAAYTTVLHALFGQTLGKLVVGIRVLAGDGPPPFGVSLLRFCAYFASVASFGAGYLMAALRRDKRALHDLIAGTRVERVPQTHESAASAPAGPPGGAAAV